MICRLVGPKNLRVEVLWVHNNLENPTYLIKEVEHRLLEYQDLEVKALGRLEDQQGHGPRDLEVQDLVVKGVNILLKVDNDLRQVGQLEDLIHLRKTNPDSYNKWV
jgi:hypothetical protein